MGSNVSNKNEQTIVGSRSIIEPFFFNDVAYEDLAQIEHAQVGFGDRPEDAALGRIVTVVTILDSGVESVFSWRQPIFCGRSDPTQLFAWIAFFPLRAVESATRPHDQ